MTNEGAFALTGVYGVFFYKKSPITLANLLEKKKQTKKTTTTKFRIRQRCNSHNEGSVALSMEFQRSFQLQRPITLANLLKKI